jgi:hypothetical protein
MTRWLRCSTFMARSSIAWHPHTHAFFTKGWATMSLRVVGREKVTVAAGTFDCWKVRLGESDFESFMWVGTANHLVVRSQTIYRFGDTEFDDRVDLQRIVPAI